MIIIRSIYDIISLFTHFIAVDIVYRAISGDAKYFVGVTLTLSLERILKFLTTDTDFLPFKRPDGACNCSIMNDGGIVDTRSGFPSGHVASTSVYMSLLYFSLNKQSPFLFIIYQIPTILMGIARYRKLCHNIFQIICGALLGYLVAYFIHIFGKNLKNKIITNVTKNDKSV